MAIPVDPDGLKKLLNPDVMKAIQAATTNIVAAALKAEEAMIVSFAEKAGFDLTPIQSGTMTAVQKMEALRGLEIVHTSPDTTLDDGSTVIQEAWCVDRRNGYEGFERTYPFVRVVRSGAAFHVQTVEHE